MKHWIAAIALLALGACAAQSLSPPDLVGTYAYRIGAGDRLRITTFGEPTLTGEFAVAGDGAIAFPLLGDVAAKGKTTQELRDQITARLGAEFIRNPRVSVEVAGFRPVFILGEVARPGEFPFAEGLSGFALIAKAGGFTYRANRKMVFIRHENEAEERAYELLPSLAIRPGDTIRVGERYF